LVGLELFINSRRTFTKGKSRIWELKRSYVVFASLGQFNLILNLTNDRKHLLTECSSNNDSFVVKPIDPPNYDQAMELQKDLSFSPYVRFPVDYDATNSALIFEHRTEDFLEFMRSGPGSRSQVKRILLDVLKGIAALHSKSWVHTGDDLPPSFTGCGGF
jgi:hypothetical protein